MAEEIEVENSNPTIQFLTDDLIVQYSENRICDNSGDINLNFDSRVFPIARGVYDQNYFGSIYENQCNCGTVRTKGVQCHNCGSKVLDDREKYHRFARIELPVYYCSSLKFKAMREFLSKCFAKIKFVIESPIRTLFLSPYSKVATNRLNKFRFDTLQFIYDKGNDTLIGTDEITDVSKCSYEGIIKIFEQHKKGQLDQFLSYINQKIIVIPQCMRPIRPVTKNGSKRWEIHDISIAYENIIYACEYYDQIINGEKGGFKDEIAHALFRGCMKSFIGRCLHKLSGLLKSSKKNIARQAFSTRIPNSGRSVIVAEPNIDIDEVTIPRHLIYEACSDEFINFIAAKYDIPKPKAEYLYKTQANSIEIQSLFDDFINGDIDKGGSYKGKYVIINRQPSLHEYAMLCCKVKLTNDYTMGLPLELCAPLGGDFDGDTMCWYVVKDEFTDICIDRMSPSKQILQKKNHIPMFMPEQDIMSGLIIATRIRREPGRVREFDSVEAAEEFRKENPEKLKIQSLITIGGKETTIGREVLGHYFNVDLNDYLENYKGYYNVGAKNEDHMSLTPNNIIPLYMKLAEDNTEEERVKKITQIRKFGEKVGTIYGVTPLTLEDMSKVTANSKNLEMIRKVSKDDSLTLNERNVSMRDYFAKYKSEMSDRLNKDMPDVVQRLNETAKSKLDQLMELSSYQINVDLFGNVSIAETTMINGMSENDFQNHAIENRAIFGIKNYGTPESGNLTRQFVFLAFNYKFSSKDDKKNFGIWIPANEADGRTLLDGTRFHSTDPSDSTPIMVRSLVSTSKSFPDHIITGDLLSNPEIYDYSHGDNIGVSMITSLTEGLTQGTLKLKHGGYLRIMYIGSQLKAPYDCELDDSGEFFLHVKDLETSQVRTYLKPSNWVKSFSPKDRYKKGDVLGYAYITSTPVSHLDALIHFIKARGVNAKKHYERNKTLFSQCYCIKTGKVHFTVEDNKPKLAIGDVTYEINDKCMYQIYEGQEVKEFERIANGVLDIKYVFDFYKKDKINPYYYFRSQFNVLMSGIANELLEFLYVLTISRSEEDEIAIDGVIRSIHEKSSFYTELAFQDARKSFGKVDYEGVELGDDPMVHIVLPLLLNNSLDKL